MGNQGWSPCIEFAAQGKLIPTSSSSPDLLSTRTDTGLCGSSLCSDAPTHSRSSTRSRLARRSTLDAESELSDSTESDRSRWLASSSESKLSCPLLHSFVYSFASSFALFEGWKAKGEACGTKI